MAKVLVLDTEDGSSRQCEESEITRDDLEGIDYARTDVIRFDVERQVYERAAIKLNEAGDYIIAQWNPL